MWRKYNPNPKGKAVGDCTVRAISMALGKPWNDVYCDLCEVGLNLCDMPSANAVWGAYLRENGFQRFSLPNTCPDCYTVEEFCREHPSGIYVLALSGHVVCVRNGDVFDSWDSRNEVPIYYWEEKR